MSETYGYIDEESINKDLICSICELPFNDPYYAPCNETFCHECITQWIQRGNNSCPHCRQVLSITVLRRAPRTLRNMLDRLRVICVACGQTELNRGNINDHIQKLCPKTIVSCPSEDRRCPWRGQRDQVNQHLVNCQFAPMRAIFTQLIVENQELRNLVNKLTIQTVEKENAIKMLSETLEQQKIQIDTHQEENEQLRNLITSPPSHPHPHPQEENEQLRNLITPSPSHPHPQEENEQLRNLITPPPSRPHPQEKRKSSGLLSCFKSRKPKPGTEQQGQPTINPTVIISEPSSPQEPV